MIFSINVKERGTPIRGRCRSKRRRPTLPDCGEPGEGEEEARALALERRYLARFGASTEQSNDNGEEEATALSPEPGEGEVKVA